MAKTVRIANVDYSDVPSIQVPLASGSGNATFYDEVGNLNITQNGSNIDVSGYATVSVSVSGGGGGGKTGDYNITSTDNGDGTQSLAIVDANGNGDYNITSTNNGDGTQSLAIVDAPDATISLQTKTKSYTPTESQQTEAVTADTGYDGLDTVNVTVGAISSTYVGSGITSRSSSDLTASGGTVTVPSGYYASQASKSVANGAVTAPSSISGTSATVSTGTNALTLSKTVSVTPNVTTAGYVSSGTAGNSSVSLTASVTTKAASTIYPSSSDQTIASGTYLTGAQTIKGVAIANLTAENIKSGVTVTVGDSSDADRVTSVTGTYSGGSANFATATTTNSSNQNTSISFTITSGRTVKAFFCRLTSQIARNSSSRYYYVYDMRWDGSSSGGVAGNQFYMYNGTLTNVTSGYSYEQSETTFTLSSTGSRSASPGSFYNGTYELLYVY